MLSYFNQSGNNNQTTTMTSSQDPNTSNSSIRSASEIVQKQLTDNTDMLTRIKLEKISVTQLYDSLPKPQISTLKRLVKACAQYHYINSFNQLSPALILNAKVADKLNFLRRIFMASSHYAPSGDTIDHEITKSTILTMVREVLIPLW